MQNAAITTASVEIKTLTVSGKQVTLAVFRQLLEEPLISQDGTFVGQPWGTVNYHPDRCANDPEHWHVVWQEGDQLRRSAVAEVPVFDDFWPDEGDLFIAAWVYTFASTGQAWRYGPQLVEGLMSRSGHAKFATAYEFPAFAGVFDDKTRAAASACLDVARAQRQIAALGDQRSTPPPEWMTSSLQRARERAKVAAEPLQDVVAGFGASIDELYEQLATAADREHERRERHRAARAAIAQLPQLFIAV